MFLCFIKQHTSIESRDVEAVDICGASASTNVHACGGSHSTAPEYARVPDDKRSDHNPAADSIFLPTPFPSGRPALRMYSSALFSLLVAVSRCLFLIVRNSGACQARQQLISVNGVQHQQRQNYTRRIRQRRAQQLMGMLCLHHKIHSP